MDTDLDALNAELESRLADLDKSRQLSQTPVYAFPVGCQDFR